MSFPDETPDEVDGVLESLTDTGNADTSADSSLSQTSDAGTHGGSQQPRLFGGKYKTLQDYDKAHKSLRGEFDKRSQRVNTLESIVNDPRIHELAKTDPVLREALVKAGVSIAAEEEAKRGHEDWDGNEDDPRYQIQVLKFQREIDREQSVLEREIGRPFKDEEWAEIQQVYRAVKGTNVRQAWMLTPSYAKLSKEREDKRIGEATAKRGNTNRPRPPSALIPGQKALNMKKPLGEMNEQEKQQHIRDIMEKNQ